MPQLARIISEARRMRLVLHLYGHVYVLRTGERRGVCMVPPLGARNMKIEEKISVYFLDVLYLLLDCFSSSTFYFRTV